MSTESRVGGGSQSAASAPPSFRPDIEVLRALAILPVVLYHARPSLVPGGYVGVDVFFVISGYLITSLLLKRLGSGTYHIAAFYAARVRRIFPALFVMLAAVVPAAVWLLNPVALADFARVLRATSAFMANVELQRTTGYFEPAAELKPLLHTWSLAVEEQYYIVFPLLLAPLVRYRRNWLAPILWAVALGSLALSAVLVRTDPAFAFYSAPTRAFELMLGSLLAAGRGMRGFSPPTRQALAGIGLACICCAWFLFDARTPFPGEAALLPACGAALLIGANVPALTAVGRILALPALRWFGAISYSLYLWHWPVLVFGRHWLLRELSAFEALIAVAVAVLVAWASMRWIEDPVRRSGARDGALLFFGALCVASGLAAAWALSGTAAEAEGRTSSANTLLQGAKDFNPRRRECHAGRDDVIAYDRNCRFGAEGGVVRTAIWADSHGAELAVALGERARRVGESVAQITSSACPPALDYSLPALPRCRAHNAITAHALAADRSVQRVVMVARYGGYLRHDAAAFEAGLRRSIEVLTGAGKQVLLIDPIPTYQYPVPAALAALQRREHSLQAFGQTVEDYRMR